MATVNTKNIQILNELSPSYSVTATVSLGAAGTIAAGTPTKAGAGVADSTYYGTVVPMVDGNGTTAQRFTGIAKSTSTDTVAAAGSVDLWLPYPGILYSGAALLSTTFDTQAEVDSAFGKPVLFDLTSSLWTVDVAATAAQINCVIITGGDYRTYSVYFNYKSSGTILGSSISA